MSKAIVELDFLGLEKNQIAPKHRAMERRNSIRGMQSAISRIDPRLLKSVIASGGALEARPPPSAGFWNASPALVADAKRIFISPPPSPLPILNPASRSVSETLPGKAPLTIFYNGTVTVFDVPNDMAENIIKMAEERNVGSGTGRASQTVFGGEDDLLANLNADLPIARKKSLQRFLEKRKERLTGMAPYVTEPEVGSVKVKDMGMMMA